MEKRFKMENSRVDWLGEGMITLLFLLVSSEWLSPVIVANRHHLEKHNVQCKNIKYYRHPAASMSRNNHCKEQTLACQKTLNICFSAACSMQCFCTMPKMPTSHL